LDEVEEEGGGGFTMVDKGRKGSNYCLMNYDCCKLLIVSARKKDCERSVDGVRGRRNVEMSRSIDVVMGERVGGRYLPLA
jgi:hypothetical protein